MKNLETSFLLRIQKDHVFVIDNPCLVEARVWPLNSGWTLPLDEVFKYDRHERTFLRFEL